MAARLAATAVLLLSLLAVANCRVIEAEPGTVISISDEQSQADTVVPQETDAAEAIPSLPTVTVPAESILRLPSHRRPCQHGFLHRHLRWARNHGLSHRRGAFSGPGDARVRPAFMPEEPREAELEAVAEPDPDSRPYIQVEENDMKKPPRRDGDGGEENESVKAWKGEMLRRFRGHGLRFHHHNHGEEELAVEVEKDDSEHQDKEEDAGDMQLNLQHVKLFRRHLHHHHNHGEEETARIHHHHNSDNEVDEVEELARKLSKAIMRRSFSRGGIRHHHHHAEEGGVRKWFKGLMNMNRF